MRATDRFAIAVAVAMVLGACSLTPLTADRSFLGFAAALVVALELVSLVLRRLGAASVLVHLAQLVVLVAAGIGLGLWSQPAGARGLAELGRLWSDAVLQVRVQVAPMRFSAGVRWLMVLLVGVVTVICDLLVISLMTPAWALAPLLTLYLIPGLALPHDVHWAVFVLLALGYLVVLAADGVNENAGWTRNLASDSAQSSHSTAGALRLAALVGVPALALSLALGSVLPRLGSLDIQSSRPRGNGPLQMADPTIDLSRNLNLPVDRVVLTYTASEPVYLRTASLSVMDANGWHMAPVQLQDGALPTPPGLDVEGKQVKVDVQVKDIGGEYLPAPYAPQSFTAQGTWRHDPLSLAIMSTRETDRADAIRNTSYSVTSVLNDPGAENFTLAKVGTPPDAKQTSAVPAGVPKAILDITHDVTKDASTPVLKAAAIQAYLANPNNFTYSTTAPSGDGFEVLTNFLTKDKAGYCIHFASAMALMARIEGIPSRVSVGFLPGEKVGDHYEVKASNMHAWPELYFADYGWVRFEPTSRVIAAPEWSLVNSEVKPLPSASATVGTASSRPSASPSASPTPSASASPAPTSSTGSDDAGLPWARILGWTASALGVLLLLLLPALVRWLTRRRRLDSSAADLARVERAWAEVRDSVHDLRLAWPAGSPREVSARLGEGLEPEAQDALGRLAMVTERSRYARMLGEVGDVAGDAATVRSSLLQGATAGSRMLAALLPVSLWLRLRGRSQDGRSQDGRQQDGPDEGPGPDAS